MRQLRLALPQERVEELVPIIADHDGSAVRRWDAEVDGGRSVYVELTVPNSEVGPFLRQVEGLGIDTVTMAPQGVLALEPGAKEAPQQVTEVDSLSAHEVYLAGLQSIGSWTGFLSYAALAGAIVWTAMIVNSTALLIAAMLIAPFAGPAMNAALATASGDLELLWQSLVRYVAAIAVVVAVSGGLHLLLGPDVITSTMAETDKVSSVAVVLPIAAGAAGALNLMQAERSSLVSGAATGVLVAAALTPPAGLVGMAGVLGEWSMVATGGFLLALQLVGLNLAGAAVFALWGARPGCTRYGRGSWGVAAAGVGVSLLVTIGLVAVQLRDSPNLQRSSVEQQAAAHISEIVESHPDAVLVETQARFTLPDVAGQDTLLGIVYVEALGAGTPSELEQRLAAQISAEIRDRFDVVPLVQVTALTAPPSSAG